MIKLTGLNHKEFYLNNNLIEKIEPIPESLITLNNGKKYLVLESIEDILIYIREDKRAIFRG
ncbi:MAG: flagellar FlbD family protein [Clostridiaceae bacterium]